MKNRWYDKHEDLAKHLEALKTLPKKRLNEILKDLITFARLLHPTLFEEHLLEYPLDMKRRRWYDDDPYLWIVVNGLRFADDEIIKKIVAFFDKQLGLKPMKLTGSSKKQAAKKKTPAKTKKTSTTSKAVKKNSAKASQKKPPKKSERVKK